METTNVEAFATEVKSEVASVKTDMATVQASVDALRTEVKSVVEAVSAPAKNAFLAEVETKSAAISATVRGTVEYKAPADMLTAPTIGNSQSLIATGPTVQLPNRPKHVRDVMSIGRLQSPLYIYDRETMPQGKPAITLEGQARPKVSFGYEQVTATVADIGSVYKVSVELAADAPALVRSFQTRGVENTLLEEDMQLLYGSGASGQAQGIMPLAQAFNPGDLAGKVPNATKYDVLRAGVSQVTQSLYQASAIMLNPADVASMDLTKDSEGRYILPTIFTNGVPSIAGVQIVEIFAINPGEFLIGAFDRAVDTFMVQDLKAETSNSNEDDFNTGKMSVRITERVLQAVTRPAAFVKGTFAAGITALTPAAPAK